MIDLIRQEIKSRIRQCSKLYKEINNPFFKSEDLTQEKIKYKYHVEMGVASDIVEGQGEAMTEIPVVLKTFVEAGKDKNADFDEAYTHALIIKELILDRLKIINKDYIKGVTSSNVTPLEVLDSQDVYSYETNFIFTISYGIGE
jgi:hypothetical protein